MLLLTRRVGETIRIGTEISVTVIAIKGGQVRLGIQAPDNVQVHREEIYQRIVQERAAAATTADDGPGSGPGPGPDLNPDVDADLDKGGGENAAAAVKITVRKSRRKTTQPK